jgi:hypothetical protein
MSQHLSLKWESPSVIELTLDGRDLLTMNITGITIELEAGCSPEVEIRVAASSLELELEGSEITYTGEVGEEE